jgi:PST family polysaccharide transporter
MQDEPGRIAVAWGRANQLVGAIAIPGLVGVALVAPELVVVVFGDRWSDLDILLRVLAIVGIVQALQRLNFSILQARGRSTSLLWVSAVGVILGLLGVAVGSRFGVVGVACGIALTSTLTQLAFMAVTARAVNVTLLSCLRPLTGVVAATAVMSMAVLGARQLCDTISVEDALALASEVAVGTIVYLAAISVFGRDMLRSVRSILADRRRERRGDSFVSGEVEGT